MTLKLLSFPLDRTSKSKAEAQLSAKRAALRAGMLHDLDRLRTQVESGEIVTIALCWICPEEYARSTFYIGNHQATQLYVGLDRVRERLMRFMTE